MFGRYDEMGEGPPAGKSVSEALSQLLAAAVVSERFRALLLTDAETALEEGYESQGFPLTAREKQQVLAIRATTLPDFAAQLLAQDGVPADEPIRPER